MNLSDEVDLEEYVARPDKISGTALAISSWLIVGRIFSILAACAILILTSLH
jgi:hypothetical protein